jgi:hypothetical protein
MKIQNAEGNVCGLRNADFVDSDEYAGLLRPEDKKYMQASLSVKRAAFCMAGCGEGTPTSSRKAVQT